MVVRTAVVHTVVALPALHALQAAAPHLLIVVARRTAEARQAHQAVVPAVAVAPLAAAAVVVAVAPSEVAAVEAVAEAAGGSVLFRD